MTTLENIFTSRISKKRMMDAVNESRESFEETVKIALSMQQPQAWRATWILDHCTGKNDGRLHEYGDQLIAIVKHRPDGHQRQILRLLQKIELNDDQEGRVFDECMSIWERIGKSPSVRYFAFAFIYQVLKKYPELKNELIILSQPEYVEALSPGIRKGVKKKIAELGLQA